MYLQTAAGEEEDDDGGDGRDGITRRDGPPDAIDRFSKERRHPENQRDEVQHLTREAQEDRLACLADRGEEVTGDHLETDDEHRRTDDTHRFDGLRH